MTEAITDEELSSLIETTKTFLAVSSSHTDTLLAINNTIQVAILKELREIKAELKGLDPVLDNISNGVWESYHSK